METIEANATAACAAQATWTHSRYLQSPCSADADACYDQMTRDSELRDAVRYRAGGASWLAIRRILGRHHHSVKRRGGAYQAGADAWLSASRGGVMVADPLRADGRRLPDAGRGPWDEARDARLYSRPAPSCRAPPCSRWCRLGAGRGRWGHKRNEDGRC